MALITFVKVNSITHLTDARYCAGMYVDLLGFALEKSHQKYVSPEQFQEITGWIAGASICGEFESSSAAEIIDQLAHYPGLTAIQHSDLDVLTALKDQELELIWKADIATVSGKENDLGPILRENSIQVLLSSASDEVKKEEVEVIREFADYAPVILGFGLSPELVNELLENLPIKGLALDGGEEIKPGLRDFEQMAELLELLEVED